MESKISAFLNKFELDVDELYDEKKVTSKLMHRINEIQLDEIFGNYYDDVNALIYSLSNDLEKRVEELEKTVKDQSKLVDQITGFLFKPKNSTKKAQAS